MAGAAIYARWRGRPSRDLIVGGAACLGVGFVVMAAAPSLAVAIVGAAFAGVGNGVESVAVRTALQEEVEEQWMALMMSLYEALFQSVPGVGMLIGGVITAPAARARHWPWPVRGRWPSPRRPGSRWPGSARARSRRPIRLDRGLVRDPPRAPAVRHQ